MHPASKVFSIPERLNLTGTERKIWLEPLLEFLGKNPTHIGSVLMGGPGPWKRKHVRELELLICSLGDREAIRNYLSILHEAARLWSADTLTRVPLPHFLPRETRFDNPFTEDFATSTSCCENWGQKLAQLITSDHNSRDVRLATFLLSAILNGRALGVPLLVALVRAIPNWRKCTFEIGGRIHIELSLSRRGVLDAEHRMWLPDPVTVIQMARLRPDDASDLLAPVLRDGRSFSPSDAAVMRRIGKLIAQYKSRGDQVDLPGIEAMRRSAREVALVDGLPAFVAYDWTELASESLRREDVPRLFPGDSLMEFIEAEAITSQSSSLTGTNTIPARSEWIVDLRSAVRSADHREALQRIVDDDDAPPALRLIANFGITLRLRTSRPGKGQSIRATANTILMLATCLGHDLESDDLAKLAPADRRKIYVEAINAQPARKRPDAVQAVREFDLFLVAKFAGTLPIQRNSLPWFRKPPAFDPNIVTHSEYNSVLMHIEDRWPVTRSERRKRITILVVALAFRCMLRRGELRGLRIEDVLLLVENPFSGDPELHLRHRKEDPLKTLAAERRIPLQLLSDDELRMLKDWLQARLSEGAKAKDYFFAIPKEHMDRIPRTLFDSLNKRLRKLTPYAAGGKGIHLHHCRHAGGTWLFVGMLLADSLRRRQLFPGLKDSHDWMEQNGYRLWDLFCGNQLPSKRLPYVVAKVCGQASFDTTASSYINIFPWLVAHDSDATNPDQRDLLRIACEASPKQFRDWLRKGGPHHVAVQVLIGKGLGAKLRNNSSANTGIDSDAATDMDWLNAIWRKLASRRKGEIKASIETDMARIFERADWLADQETRNHHPRHPVERTPGGGPSADKSTKSVAPLQPPQSKNDVSPSLLRLLRDRAVADGAALAEALAIFGRFHERDGFVAFRSIDQIELADRYIKLLGKLGFGLREMDVVCGVTDGKSRVLREWRDQFRAKGHKGLRIRPCPSGGSYSPRGSLWVRPSLDALRARKTGPSCFRYLMAMGFIAYGEIPKPATVARSPATV